MPRLIDRYYHLLSRALVGSPLSASAPLGYIAFGTPVFLFGMPRLGLFEHDELLGWRLRPGVSVVEPAFEFRARYTTTAGGQRYTPGNGRGPAIHLLGCSWSFGSSVSDGETFAARLGREFNFTNHAVPGYGTTQAYLLMTRRGVVERAAREGASILYGWIPAHPSRVWRRRSWYEHLELAIEGAYRGNPLCEIEDGRLVFRGLARVGDSRPDDDPLVDRMEWRITMAALEAMRDAAHAARVPFSVALLPTFAPDGDDDERMLSLLARLGIESMDLRRPGDDRDLRLTFQHDPHPTPAGQRRIADRLGAALRVRATT